MKFKYLILSLTIFSFAYSNKPSLFLTINKLEKEKRIVIGSENIWDIGYVPFDEAEHFKENDYYFHGDDEEYRQVIWIEGNKTEIIAYFPLQKNGRELVATTTIHLTIKINYKEVFNSEHFGQCSEFYVTKKFGILPRPKNLSIHFVDSDNTTISIDGMIGETKYENGNALQEHFAITYNLNKNKRIDDEKLAKDEKRYKRSLKRVNTDSDSPPEEKHTSVKNITTCDVNETLNLFHKGRKAYQTLEFIAHNHKDIYGINYKDWLTPIDLRIKPLKSNLWDEKIIAVQYEYVEYDNKTFLRIYDPKFSIYSNLVKLHDQNSVVNRKQKTVTLKNKKHNTVLKGIEVLNPIKRNKIKIVFHHKHIIKSIKVEPATIDKKIVENTITFSGEGMENLAYEIEYEVVPYEIYEPKKGDLVASTITLSPEEDYIILAKSDSKKLIKVYVNNMLLLDEMYITEAESMIPPFVLNKEIVDNIVIENVSQEDGIIQVLLKNKKLQNVIEMEFLIAKGQGKKINFEYKD